MIGIYKITNIINGDFYIGSTIQSFNKRLLKHKSAINNYLITKNHKHNHCPKLYNAIIYYGMNNFKFEIFLFSLFFF